MGFVVTNLRRDAYDVVRFYDGRGTAGQRIKEGKNAVKWTRLSCHDFVENEVQLRLFAFAPSEFPNQTGLMMRYTPRQTAVLGSLDLPMA